MSIFIENWDFFGWTIWHSAFGQVRFPGSMVLGYPSRQIPLQLELPKHSGAPGCLALDMLGTTGYVLKRHTLLTFLEFPFGRKFQYSVFCSILTPFCLYSSCGRGIPVFWPALQKGLSHCIGQSRSKQKSLNSVVMTASHEDLYRAKTGIKWKEDWSQLDRHILTRACMDETR